MNHVISYDKKTAQTDLKHMNMKKLLTIQIFMYFLVAKQL